MDTNKIDKIDTNLIVPSIQENLIEIERDKWGNILNEQTFKTLNNNMKVMKEILLEIANENNVTNLDSIKLRLNNLETDRDSIESIVDNNTNGLINVGIIERKLNLKGTELEFNSNKVDLDNVAYTNRENTFSENINNTKVYKLKGGTVLENIDNKIKIGNISNKLDLQTTDGTFLVNGEKFRLSSEEVKALLDTTDFQATETINGTSKIATQTEVDNGLENTKIVTSKKLKARLDTLLAGITSTYVLKTDNATETVAGITKIATQSEINAGTDDSKLVTSKKLASMLNSKLSTYVKNTDNASETIKGVSKYGTTDGTALEGNQLAKVMGVESSKIGGLISTAGTKTAGNIYYDTLTESYYLCNVTNNQNFIDLVNFTPVSNTDLLDKINNLSRSRSDLIPSEFLVVPNNTTGNVYTYNLPVSASRIDFIKFTANVVSAGTFSETFNMICKVNDTDEFQTYGFGSVSVAVNVKMEVNTSKIKITLVNLYPTLATAVLKSLKVYYL